MAYNIRMGVPEMAAYWNNLREKNKSGAASKAEQAAYKKIGKALKLIAENPRHPGLQTHEISALTKRYGGVKVWQSYDWYTDYGMDQLYGGTVMKLIGNLKKQVEKAESKQEKKSLIENAGMLLSDDELENVAGGKSELFKPYMIYCAGVVARNGKVITPGCDFIESHPSWDSAIQIMTKKYKNKCPRCKIHPLDLRAM